MGKYAMRKYINIICESETDWDAEMAQCDQTAKALTNGRKLKLSAPLTNEDSRTIRYIKRRYTCEWCEDWHPEHPDYDPTWDREKRNPSKYSGVIDAERENDLMKKHGDQYWHLPKDQRQHINAYREKLKSYGDGTPDRTFD